jgi:hypothetical protein
MVDGGSFEKWFKSNSLSRVVIEKLKAPSTFYDCRITFLSAARFIQSDVVAFCAYCSAAAFASLKETASGVSTLCAWCALPAWLRSVFINAKNDGVRKFSLGLRAKYKCCEKATHPLSAQPGGNEIAENRHKVWQPLSGQLIKVSARAEKKKKRHSISFCVHRQKRSRAVCFHYKFWQQLFTEGTHTQRKYKQTF